MPYIATAQRESHDTGLQILRPMYYTHPLAEAAYADQGLHQYFWGPDVWAAPIAAPFSKDNASSLTGIALRSQAESKMAQEGKLTPGVGAVPATNSSLSQRNGRVAWPVWVPPGSWIEWFSWSAVRGSAFGDKDAPPAPTGATARSYTGEGSYIIRNYSISEMPIFSRPGAIIPQRTLPDATSVSGGGVRATPHRVDGAEAGDGSLGAPPPAGGSSLLGLASQPYDDLTLWVLPLTPDSEIDITTSARLYEDDGLSRAAEESGEFAWTALNCTWSRGVAEVTASGVSGFFKKIIGGAKQDSVTCVIGAPVGGPGGTAGVPDTRAILWRFIGSFPPSTVLVDGVVVTRDQPAAPDSSGDNGGWLAGANNWAYGGSTLSTWVRIGARVAAAEAHTVTLRWAPGLEANDPMLTSGYARILARALVCKDEVDRGYSLVFPSDAEPLLALSAAATAMGAADGPRVKELLAAIPGQLSDALTLVSAWAIPMTSPSGFVMQQRCLGALYDAAVSSAQSLQTVPVPRSDPRLRHAISPPKYGSTIEHGRGSSPGQITQYSTTPGQDEATSEEGLEDYYDAPAFLGEKEKNATGKGGGA